ARPAGVFSELSDGSAATRNSGSGCSRIVRTTSRRLCHVRGRLFWNRAQRIVPGLICPFTANFGSRRPATVPEFLQRFQSDLRRSSIVVSNPSGSGRQLSGKREYEPVFAAPRPQSDREQSVDVPRQLQPQFREWYSGERRKPDVWAERLL